MLLHVLNASPSSAAFRDCVKIMRTGDALVLLGDAAYAAIEGTRACDELLGTGARIHLLRSDAVAAGVVSRIGAITIIDMDGFVTLTEQFPRQQCWF